MQKKTFRNRYENVMIFEQNKWGGINGYIFTTLFIKLLHALHAFFDKKTTINFNQ